MKRITPSILNRLNPLNARQRNRSTNRSTNRDIILTEIDTTAYENDRERINRSSAQTELFNHLHQLCV